MPEVVTGRAQGDQVGGDVGAAPGARCQMVDFEEAGAVAAGGLALVAVTGQGLAAGFGRDRGCVALARFADGGIAGEALGIGAAQATAVRFGLAALGALMDVDLDRPPGGGFL